MVYEDSAQDTTAITHIKGVDGDQTAKIILNGNTVKAATSEKTDDNTSDNTTGTKTDKTNETKPTFPKTGDNTPIMLYVLVLLGSGLGIAGVAVASKKRKRNTQ